MDLAKASDQIDQLIERREKVVGELRRMAGTAEGEGAAMRPNARRIQDLERRARNLVPGHGGGARAYLSGLLARYAAARRAGTISEELGAEFRTAHEAVGSAARRLGGEGSR